LLKLRLDTTYLDLAEGESLSLTVTCPLFDQDGAEALFSFPFRLPATPRNLAALAHANRLDNADNTTTYTNCALEIEGLPFEPSGVLELDDQAFTADTITAVFKNMASTIFEEMERVDINAALETLEVPQVTEARWYFELSPPASPGTAYAIIVDGISYSYTATTSLNVEVTQSLALLLNAAHPGMADAGFWDELRLYSSVVNDHLVRLDLLTNLTLGSVITLGEAAQTNFQEYLTDTNNTPRPEVSFPYIYWEKYYKDLVAGYLLRANPWVDGAAITNLPAATQFTWLATFIPFVRVPYVLNRIAAAIPDFFTVHTGFFAETDGEQLIIFNNRSLDLLYYDRYADAGTGTFKYLNGFKQSIDLNRHVPDLTGADFVRQLLSQFALYLRIVGTGIEFLRKRDMLASAPIDWTSLSEPGYTANRRRRRGFILQYPDLRPEDRNFLPGGIFDGQLDPYLLGEGYTKYYLPAATCKELSTVIALPASNTILKCPTINQPGSSDEGGIEDNDYSFRLLFDRGLQLTDASDPYVMASHDNTDQSGATIADLSLDLNATDGLYQQHHKGILGLLADGQPVTLAMRLSIADILTARQWTNARRTITLPEGQVTAVIKSIKFKADANGLGISLVEFVQEK